MGIALSPALWRHAQSLSDEEIIRIYGAPARIVARLIGVDPATAERVRQELGLLDLEKEKAKLRESSISFVTRADPEYPPVLRCIYDPPAALFYRGVLSAPEKRVAIVGSRRATASGRSIAREMARELAGCGVEVVSGLARGIDGAAHEGALEAGRTVAVLGSGLNCLYPAEHRGLARQIADAGVVMSEYPPLTPPRPLHFPARNRIISGLCAAVVIVEAARRSGALITADFALEHGREVLAVPGPVRSPASAGCHRLLQQGAGLVTGAEDVLQAIGWDGIPRVASPPTDSTLSPDQKKLLEKLEFEPTHVDSIVEAIGSPAAVVLGDLGTLEIEGYIAKEPGGRYSRLK